MNARAQVPSPEATGGSGSTTWPRCAKMATIEVHLAEATEVSPLAPLIGADDVAAA